MSGGLTSPLRAPGVPITAYGVGSSLLGHQGSADGLQHNFDFTGDVVEVDGRPESKVGRRFHPNPRLRRVVWEGI